MDLPSSEQFAAVVGYVRKSATRWNDNGADFIEGMAYSGMRLKEAGRIEMDMDINFDKELIAVRGTKTATSERMVPITDSMRQLLTRLPKDRPEVFRTKSALGSLLKPLAERYRSGN